MQILTDRNKGGFELAPVMDKLKPRERELKYFKDKKLGVIDIHGGITDVPYYGLCGEMGVSHQAIRDEVEQLISLGAETIVLDQNSNGGMAHMAFESSNYIRNLADENGVKIISYVSGKSFSASYVYTAIAHEVITNPSAEVGSIGVRATLLNNHGFMKNLGIEEIHITAGEGKVPKDKDGNFTEEFLADIYEGVLETYEQFTDHVAMWRGIEKEKVVALGAKTYSSKKSASNGLVDAVMTLDEFNDYLNDVVLSGDKMSNPITNLINKNKKGAEMSAEYLELEASLQQLKAEHEQLSLTKTQLETELSAALTQLKAVEQERKLEKQASRLAQLKAVVGDKQAAEQAETMASFSDEQFSSVLALLSASKSVVENSVLMTELGDEGDDEDPSANMSMEDKILAAMENHRKQSKQK